MSENADILKKQTAFIRHHVNMGKQVLIELKKQAIQVENPEEVIAGAVMSDVAQWRRDHGLGEGGLTSPFAGGLPSESAVDSNQQESVDMWLAFAGVHPELSMGDAVAKVLQARPNMPFDVFPYMTFMTDWQREYWRQGVYLIEYLPIPLTRHGYRTIDRIDYRLKWEYVHGFPEETGRIGLMPAGESPPDYRMWYSLYYTGGDSGVDIIKGVEHITAVYSRDGHPIRVVHPDGRAKNIPTLNRWPLAVDPNADIPLPGKKWDDHNEAIVNVLQSQPDTRRGAIAAQGWGEAEIKRGVAALWQGPEAQQNAEKLVAHLKKTMPR